MTAKNFPSSCIGKFYQKASKRGFYCAANLLAISSHGAFNALK